MDNREMARWFGLGRAAIGAGLFAVPSLAAASWVGRDAQTAGVRTISRGFGARDVALGIGLLAALEDKDDAAVRRFLLLGALADGGDLAGTMANWRRLPAARRTLVAAAILGFGGLGLWLSQEFA
jgi:hypothetical protein